MIMHKRIIGIDFSGARNACGKIWLAEELINGNTLLCKEYIESFFRVAAGQIPTGQDTVRTGNQARRRHRSAALCIFSTPRNKLVWHYLNHTDLWPQCSAIQNLD